MKRRLKFTITKIRLQTNANSAFDSRAVCHVCNAETEMPTAAESIAFLEGEDPMLAKLIANGKINAVHTEGDSPRIRANSITQKGEL